MHRIYCDVLQLIDTTMKRYQYRFFHNCEFKQRSFYEKENKSIPTFYLRSKSMALI